MKGEGQQSSKLRCTEGARLQGRLDRDNGSNESTYVRLCSDKRESSLSQKSDYRSEPTVPKSSTSALKTHLIQVFFIFQLHFLNFVFFFCVDTNTLITLLKWSLTSITTVNPGLLKI